MSRNAISGKPARILRRVIERILEEPRRFDMKQWYQKKSGKTAPPCGTVACIAGWTMLDGISHKKLATMDTHDLEVLWQGQDEVCARLSITPKQGERLFFLRKASDDPNSDGWPKEFRIAHRKAKGPRMKAKVAAKRIEHFIKTGE